jgi:fucose 4-O-acetylase-like acetyltransferase
MEKRILYLDLVKAFAILCVVWGHSIQYMSNNNFFTNPTFEFIYSFHMPLFMILSGYFFSSSLNLSFLLLLKNKFHQLILPIISWSLLIASFFYIGHWIIAHEAHPIQHFFNNVEKNFIESLWFLKSLFSCYIVSYIGIKTFRKDWIACMLTILYFLIFPSPFMERFMLPFFWVGIFLKKYNFRIEKYYLFLILPTLILFIILLNFWKGDYSIYRSYLNEFIYYKKISFYFHDLEIAIYRFFIGTIGSLFFIFIFHYIYDKSPINLSGISKLGQHTLGIYILQYYILEHGISRWKLPSMNILFYNFIATPILAILVIFICLLCIRLLTRSKNINAIFLGNRSKI